MKLDIKKTIHVPSDVKKIIETIEQAGFEAYAVGGCVRDCLLGRIPNDWDITTSAKPDQVKNLFKRTIDTGIQHGTVTVMMNHVGYEVTTYRIDGEYEDSRHPKNVTFTSNLIEDLKRRDFTINALAYNDRSGIVDAFQGMEDLENGIIKAVGNPMDRFTEDALRMMRAVRFSAQLGYDIEKETKNAIVMLSDNLKNISAERIQVELIKLVSSPHPEKIRDLYETGITRVIMPEFDDVMQTKQNNPHHRYSVGEHIIHSMMAVEEDKVLRLAMLFHDFGKSCCKTTDQDGIDHFHGHASKSKDMSHQILRRLKFDNDTISKVETLVLYHDYEVLPETKYVRRAMNKIGEENFKALLKVKKADLAAQSDYLRQEKQKKLETIKELYEEVLAKKQCVSLKTLQFTGSNLIEMGMKPGKEIGSVLNKLLECVIDNPMLNDTEKLRELAKTIIEEM